MLEIFCLFKNPSNYLEMRNFYLTLVFAIELLRLITFDMNVAKYHKHPFKGHLIWVDSLGITLKQWIFELQLDITGRLNARMFIPKLNINYLINTTTIVLHR